MSILNKQPLIGRISVLNANEAIYADIVVVTSSKQSDKA